MVAAAMYNLSCSPAESVLCAEHVVAAGALPQLVRLCANPAQDPEGAVLAIRSIANISCTTTTRAQMVDLGVAAACVNVVDKSASDGNGWNAGISVAHAQRCCKRMRANCSVILCNLAAINTSGGSGGDASADTAIQRGESFFPPSHVSPSILGNCFSDVVSIAHFPAAAAAHPSHGTTTQYTVVNDGLLSAIQSLLNSLPMHARQADSDDDENVGELDIGAISGGHGLEDMTDYAHATILRRCAIILRNVSCDRHCREVVLQVCGFMHHLHVSPV